TITVKKADSYIGVETVFDITKVMPIAEVVALILKLDAATPKDAKPLRVSSEDQDQLPLFVPGIQTITAVPIRELGLDANKATLVYFKSFPTVELPKGGKLYFANENPFDVKVVVTLAQGPKST